MRHATRSGVIGLVTVLGVALSACGSDEPAATPDPTPAPTASATPSEPAASSKPTQEPEATTIDITFDGDKVKPDGVSRKVEAGEPILVRIVADSPGEIHVHSSPEQQISYPAGTTTKTLVIDQPGVVEVESHDLGRLIVQLEVR